MVKTSIADSLTIMRIAVDGKADINHTHAIIEVTGLVDALDAKLENDALDTMATKQALTDAVGLLNTAIEGKADTEHTHEISEINGLMEEMGDIRGTLTQKVDTAMVETSIADSLGDIRTAIDDKADIDHHHQMGDIDGLPESIEEMNESISLKVDTVMVETSITDSLSEIRNILADKADANHFHDIDDIDGLSEALHLKVDTAMVETSISDSLAHYGDVVAEMIMDTMETVRKDIDGKADTNWVKDIVYEASVHPLHEVLTTNNDGGEQQIKNIADPTEEQDAVTLKTLRDSINMLRMIANDLHQHVEDLHEMLSRLHDCAGKTTVGTETVNACDSYEWKLRDQVLATYTESAVVTRVLMNANVAFCDSVVTLNITVNHASHGTDMVKVRATSYTWIDGNTYNEDNNTATHVLSGANSNGCDSVVKLDLVFEESLPEGALQGVFSMSENEHVYFAKGNLQYQASTNTYRFAEHQYDYLYSSVGNRNASETQSEWQDLFAYGTSGWESGAVSYQPWHLTEYNTDYISRSLTGEWAEADWGIHNPISNGGNAKGMWRLPTIDEWNYLLKIRDASTVAGVADARYMKVMIGEVKGLLIFPDIYETPMGVREPSADQINRYANSVDYFEITLDEWEKMEEAGCVFLPGAGKMEVSNGVLATSDNGCGFYQSSTFYGGVDIYGLYFNATKNNENQAVETLAHNVAKRARSVRLVLVK